MTAGYGPNQWVWDTHGMPDGVYAVQFRAGDATATQNVVISRNFFGRRLGGVDVLNGGMRFWVVLPRLIPAFY